jgi:hypothetical protein
MMAVPGLNISGPTQVFDKSDWFSIPALGSFDPSKLSLDFSMTVRLVDASATLTSDTRMELGSGSRSGFWTIRRPFCPTQAGAILTPQDGRYIASIPDSATRRRFNSLSGRSQSADKFVPTPAIS